LSRAVEETNRRMLRARDAMDRDYARDYGTDSGLRDPFGNHIRIGQPK
jgi:hypothetical protein